MRKNKGNSEVLRKLTAACLFQTAILGTTQDFQHPLQAISSWIRLV